MPPEEFEAADPRLRPRGHRDRPTSILPLEMYHITVRGLITSKLITAGLEELRKTMEPQQTWVEIPFDKF